GRGRDRPLDRHLPQREADARPAQHLRAAAGTRRGVPARAARLRVGAAVLRHGQASPRARALRPAHLAPRGLAALVRRPARWPPRPSALMRRFRRTLYTLVWRRRSDRDNLSLGRCRNGTESTRSRREVVALVWRRG